MSRGRGNLRLSLEQFAALPRSREGYIEVDPHKPVRESIVLTDTLALLKAHPLVHFAERVNKGFGRLERPDGSLSPPLNWGYVDALDITGGMKTGHRLEVEVKRPGQKPSKDQQAILDGLAMAGACAFWVDEASQIFDAISKWDERRRARS